MSLLPLDRYLLDGVPSKGEAIASALRERSDDPRAQPFYRALGTVGVQAADEALLALRLVLAGLAVDDEGIRALRDARARSKAGDPAGRAAYLKTLGTSEA